VSSSSTPDSGPTSICSASTSGRGIAKSTRRRLNSRDSKTTKNCHPACAIFGLVAHTDNLKTEEIAKVVLESPERDRVLTRGMDVSNVNVVRRPTGIQPQEQGKPPFRTHRSGSVAYMRATRRRKAISLRRSCTSSAGKSRRTRTASASSSAAGDRYPPTVGFLHRKGGWGDIQDPAVRDRGEA
jgi:hypothetical protein